MSHVVILNGSPRRGGNTDLLVKAFAEGLDGRNTVDVIHVADHDVNPCIGCNSCRTNGNRCCWEDDMVGLYGRISDGDVLVIASPVYFYGLSSQLKTVVDRLHNRIRQTFKTKGLVLLAVAEDGDASVFDSMVLQYERSLEFFKLNDMGRVLVPGVSKKGDIAGRKELDDARHLASTIS